MSEKELGKKVKSLRNRKGLSQELLAEKSGLSLRTIQRIENGETEPRGETLKRLASTLEVSPDEIADWTLIEDKDFLTNMNSTALTFLLFPLLGLIIPLVLWINKKSKIHKAQETGAEIINFQITWLLLFFIAFPVASVLRGLDVYRRLEETGDISPAIIHESTKAFYLLLFGFWAVLYLYNIASITINTNRIKKGKNVKYFPKIKFLR